MGLTPSRKTIGQVVRYGVTGLTQTAVSYSAYLLLTFLGLDPKLAMTIVFAVAVAISYTMNRNWTFEHSGSVLVTGVQYASVYGVGYLLNLLGLYVFVDVYGLPHQWVQLALIFGLGLYFFTTLKLLVFRPDGNDVQPQ